MNRSVIFVLALTVVLTGCVTPKVVEQPATTVNFHQFKTVQYKVHALPNAEYGSGEADMQYARGTITLTDTLLAKKLESMGYSVVSESSAADFNIDVAVTAVKPGSPAARFWVGFGAGRAIYEFEAKFTDAQGHSLGKFQGGRSYTGMEFGKAFSTRDEIQTFAATRAVEQIEQYMNGGGSFTKEAKASETAGR